MADTLATLSSASFVDDPGTLADRLFAYSQVSNWSQSYVSRGGVYSLPYILQQYMNDAFGLANALEEAYKGLYSGFFDEVYAKVDVDPDSTNSNLFNISMRMKLVRNGQAYDLAKLLRSEDGKLKDVSELTLA